MGTHQMISQQPHFTLLPSVRGWSYFLWFGTRVRSWGKKDNEILRLRCVRNDTWVEGGGWVPAPRLHGGRISTRGQREGDGMRLGWVRGMGVVEGGR